MSILSALIKIFFQAGENGLPMPSSWTDPRFTSQDRNALFDAFRTGQGVRNARRFIRSMDSKFGKKK